MTRARDVTACAIAPHFATRTRQGLVQADRAWGPVGYSVRGFALTFCAIARHHTHPTPVTLGTCQLFQGAICRVTVRSCGKFPAVATHVLADARMEDPCAPVHAAITLFFAPLDIGEHVAIPVEKVAHAVCGLGVDFLTC